MEFKHLNQPDYDRERDGAVQKIMRNPHRHDWSVARVACEAYNEGYKQALRDWYGALSSSTAGEIIAEVDKIDKEG